MANASYLKSFVFIIQLLQYCADHSCTKGCRILGYSFAHSNTYNRVGTVHRHGDVKSVPFTTASLPSMPFNALRDDGTLGKWEPTVVGQRQLYE
jgi:hypothetical protein